MMQVFGFPTSPFVRKVMLIAAEKGMDYELVPATPHRPTEEFIAASPFRMMPAIQDGDYALSDSTAIAHYLEAKRPLPALIPNEPKARGRVIWLEEFSDTILGAQIPPIAFNLYIGPELLGIPGDEARANEAKEKIQRALDYLETIVPDEGWLMGEFSLADIAIATALATLLYAWNPLGPRAQAWYDRMAARPTWQDVRAQEKILVDALLAERSGS